jgi:hypothetical protein
MTRRRFNRARREADDGAGVRHGRPSAHKKGTRMRSNYVAYTDLMQAGQDLVEAVYRWDVGTASALVGPRDGGRCGAHRARRPVALCVGPTPSTSPWRAGARA